MDLLQPMMILGLLAGGMGVALLGSIKVALAKKLEIDEARIGGLVSMFGFAMIPVILSVGFLTDLVGPQPVIVGGSILMAGSLILLGRAKSYGTALLGVLLLSASWSALVNVLNVLIPIAFSGHGLAYATNLANTYFGLGAFLTPLVIIYLLNRLKLSSATMVLAALVVAIAVLAMGVDYGALAPAAAKEVAAEPVVQAGMADLLSNPVMWLCALAMLFYAPMEATMAAWATTYVGDKGASEKFASTLLSGFWLAFLISRLVTAFCLPAGNETFFILGLALAAIALWVGAVCTAGRMMAAAVVILAGLILGPIFPTIIAVLLGNVEPSLHGRAIGLFFAIGGIGWSVIPIMIGAYARKTSVQRGFLFAVASAVGLTVVALALLGTV